MSRNAALIAIVVLLATACDRNKTPDLVRGAGAPVATPALPPPPLESSPQRGTDPGKPAVASAGAGKSTPARSSAAQAPDRAAPGGANRRPGARSTADDPCAGLDGADLDDCLGFDAGEAGKAQRGQDFEADQRERDRALMERDAREAADRADAADEGDEPPPGDADAPIDPQDQLSPDDEYQRADDGYDPGRDEPPPDDGSGS